MLDITQWNENLGLFSISKRRRIEYILGEFNFSLILVLYIYLHMFGS